MNELRAIDRIDTGPRFSAADAIRLNRMFRGASTQEMLEAVLRDRLAGETAVVSSFGAESAVLTHLIAQVDPSVPVLFLETGKHLPETPAYRDALVARLGLKNFVNITQYIPALARKAENRYRWLYAPHTSREITQ